MVGSQVLLSLLIKNASESATLWWFLELGFVGSLVVEGVWFVIMAQAKVISS